MIQFETDEERKLVDELQTRLQDITGNVKINYYEPQDIICLRFLRARDNNIDKAEDMIRRSIKWRTDKNIESYLNWKAPKVISESMHFRCTGMDNEGRPVIYLPIAKWKGRELVELGHKEDLIKFAYFMFESLANYVKEANAHQVGAIFGLEELTMWKIASIETMQVLYSCLQDLAHNYPECMKYIFVVNAPWIFSIAFSFIKPIMTARSMAKMQVFNSDKTKWIPALLEKMPKESVPYEYLENTEFLQESDSTLL